MNFAASRFVPDKFLPELLPGGPLHLGSGDVVIHAPGFEDRTMAVAASIVSRDGARALLLDYLPYNSKNRLCDVREALEAAGVEVCDRDILSYHRFEPDNFESRLQERLLTHSARRAVVDISSMSKLAIMLVLGVCRRLDMEVDVLYTEAESYAPTNQEFDKARAKKEIHQPTLQVFTGIHGVVRLDSLSSVAMQGQPTAALVFMSLNDALTQVLLDTVYPSRLFLINGRPPVHTWRESATAWIHDQVRREWEEDNPVVPAVGCDIPLPKRAVSTLQYSETVSMLLELYWRLSSTYRILLAPSGSKMQTVGCFVVKALHPDIQVEYPSPEGFLPEYSHGIGKRWLVKFGHFARLFSVIAAAERHEYLEINA